MVEQAIRASVQYAFDHPDASRDYVRAHAQEMSPEVCAQHIALYVNAFSLDVGERGAQAIARLVEAVRALARSQPADAITAFEKSIAAGNVEPLVQLYLAQAYFTREIGRASCRERV